MAIPFCAPASDVECYGEPCESHNDCKYLPVNFCAGVVDGPHLVCECA